MTAALDIHRHGDEWIIKDGSARIRITKPGVGIIERLVENWKDKTEREHPGLRDGQVRLSCQHGHDENPKL